MRAIPVVPNRLITVVAKSAETFRGAILSQQTEKNATATQLLSLPVAAAIDVVNVEGTRKWTRRNKRMPCRSAR